MEPEVYWERVSTRIDLSEEERRQWRFDSLPEKSILQERIEKLNEQQDLLEELSGDANSFLRSKISHGELEIQQLESLETLLSSIRLLVYLNYKDVSQKPEEKCDLITIILIMTGNIKIVWFSWNVFWN